MSPRTETSEAVFVVLGTGVIVLGADVVFLREEAVFNIFVCGALVVPPRPTAAVVALFC